MTLLKRRAQAAMAALTRPPYIVPGHFYSPLTAPHDNVRALTWEGTPGVDLREEAQLALAAQLRPVMEVRAPGPRFSDGNPMYGGTDAAVYRAMLRHLRPARVIEAGSGFSTALALDEAGASPALAGLRVTAIDPYPQRLLGLLRAGDEDRLVMIRDPVQDVPLAVYSELRAGDILFIDSSHVAKAGSDVLWLILHILPRLAPGVVVHVHDVFWPFSYPAQWLAEGRDWNEAYFLHAFLSGNSNWEMLLFCSWLRHCHLEALPEQLATSDPGAIWLRKTSKRGTP